MFNLNVDYCSGLHREPTLVIGFLTSLRILAGLNHGFTSHSTGVAAIMKGEAMLALVMNSRAQSAMHTQGLNGKFHVQLYLDC